MYLYFPKKSQNLKKHCNSRRRITARLDFIHIHCDKVVNSPQAARVGDLWPGRHGSGHWWIPWAFHRLFVFRLLWLCSSICWHHICCNEPAQCGLVGGSSDWTAARNQGYWIKMWTLWNNTYFKKVVFEYLSKCLRSWNTIQQVGLFTNRGNSLLFPQILGLWHPWF